MDGATVVCVCEGVYVCVYPFWWQEGISTVNLQRWWQQLSTAACRQQLSLLMARRDMLLVYTDDDKSCRDVKEW